MRPLWGYALRGARVRRAGVALCGRRYRHGEEVWRAIGSEELAADCGAVGEPDGGADEHADGDHHERGDDGEGPRNALADRPEAAGTPDADQSDAQRRRRLDDREGTEGEGAEGAGDRGPQEGERRHDDHA